MVADGMGRRARRGGAREPPLSSADTGAMISQLYAAHEDLDAERTLDRIIDRRRSVRIAAIRAASRDEIGREVDTSPLACWLEKRPPAARARVCLTAQRQLGLRLGVRGEDELPTVGGRNVHIEHLHGGQTVREVEAIRAHLGDVRKGSL